MDVHSCPGGAGAISPLPPLFLCQYVNGYSDAMLLHVADRRHAPWHAAASTTATHCDSDDAGISHSALITATQSDVEEEESRCIETRRGGGGGGGSLTVQTRAIVEPRGRAPHAADSDSPCVCGQSHDAPPNSHRPDRPSDAPDPPPSTTNPRDLPSPLHPSPSLPGCVGPRWKSDAPDAAYVKATTLSSPAEVDRRRLLSRLLLGRRDELALSPVYCDETFF